MTGDKMSFPKIPNTDAPDPDIAVYIGFISLMLRFTSAIAG